MDLPVNVTVLGNHVHPNLHPYLAAIAARTIDLLQTGANNNPLRMFLFNQLGNNRFNNNEFLGLLKAICRIVEYYAATGTAVEQAIAQAIDIAIQFAALNNAKQYQHLVAGVDQNTIERLRQLDIRQMDLNSRIQGYEDQKLARQQMSQQQHSYFQFNAPQVQSFSSLWDTSATEAKTPWGSTPEHPAPMPSYPAWRSPPPQADAVTPPPITQTSSTNWRESAVPTVQVSTTPTTPTYVMDGKTFVKQGDPGVVWKPSARWPVNLSASVEADIYYRLHDTGEMEPVIVKLKPEEITMDRKNHFAAVPTPVNSIMNVGAQQRRVDIENGEWNICFSKAANKIEDDSSVEDMIVKDDTASVVTSIEEALELAQSELIGADYDKPTHGYVKPVIRAVRIPDKDTHLVAQLRAVETFEQSIAILSMEKLSVTAEVDPRKRKRRLLAYSKVNRLLTNAVNDYLKLRLSIAGVFMESFDTDMEELLTRFSKYFHADLYSALYNSYEFIKNNVLRPETSCGNMIDSTDPEYAFQRVILGQIYSNEIIASNHSTIMIDESVIVFNGASIDLVPSLGVGEVLHVHADTHKTLYKFLSSTISQESYMNYFKTSDMTYRVVESSTGNMYVLERME